MMLDKTTAKLTLLCLMVTTSLFAQQSTWTKVQEFAPDFDVSFGRPVDLDADGKTEFVVVACDGRVLIYPSAKVGAGFSKVAKEGPLLPNPEHTLLAFTPLDGEGKALSLVTVTPKGFFVYAPVEGGNFAKKGKRLARRARFKIRVGEPREAAIMRDVNGDGRMDLILPQTDAVELWTNTLNQETKEASFQKSASVAVKVEVDSEYGVSRGSEVFSHEIVIPDLDVLDVNGDGRQDLIVRRSNTTRFHKQKADGTIPVEPDVVLDLSKFRDTTAKASVRPGYTYAGTERARRMMRDLDGDGMLDYVISHRRKVWVFHGSKDGPQFTQPSSILKTADDVTLIWLADLNRDNLVDLVILRVEVPSIGAFISGFLGSLSVNIRAVGYPSENGKQFSRKAGWSNDIEINLPSLGEILRNPQALLDRIENAGKSIRAHVRLDFNGDKKEDLVVFKEDRSGLESWVGKESGNTETGSQLDSVVREVFFEGENNEWDIDRLVAWLENFGSRDLKKMTGDRDPDSALKFRDTKEARFEMLYKADFEGDGKEELLLNFLRRGTRHRQIFEIWAAP